MTLLPSIFENRRSPFASLEDMMGMFSDWTPNVTFNTIRVDLKETPSEYVVKADLPGFEKKDVNITLANQLLTIAVEREFEEEEKAEEYLLRERRLQSMRRSIPLAFAGAPENVKAEFKNGVLEIHVRKSPEKQTKHIPIQ